MKTYGLQWFTTIVLSTDAQMAKKSWKGHNWFFPEENTEKEPDDREAIVWKTQTQPGKNKIEVSPSLHMR